MLPSLIFNVDRLLRLLSTIALTTFVAACATPTVTSHPKPPPRTPQSVSPAPLKAQFIRPSAGPTITRYDSARSKGIDIAGHAGDPVVAAADGRVVYVGDQLRGYGKMVIVKHDETFLTAYAHNQAILVKENDLVVQNQKIAEMGQSDSDRVKLHFELRKSGVAVDPEPYLAGRAH
jgi:lipoprotein NlpD